MHLLPIGGVVAAALVVLLTVSPSVGTAIAVSPYPAEIAQLAPEGKVQLGGIGGWQIQNPSPGSITAVAFLFVQPTITCNSSQMDKQDFLIAGGIFNANFTVHAVVATWALCKVGASSPAYFAGFTRNGATPCRVFVGDGCIIGNFSVNSGDLIFGSVSWSPGNVTSYLADLTTHQTFARVAPVAGLTPNLALCGQTQQFDIAKFSKFHLWCFPTISGVTGPIGGFSHPSVVTKLVTTDRHGRLPLVAVSSLFVGRSTFTITWIKSEPS